MPQVIVDVCCDIGDLVKCTHCEKVMLINLGGTKCIECGSDDLQWYDLNRSEWTVEELIKHGFAILEMENL